MLHLDEHCLPVAKAEGNQDAVIIEIGEFFANAVGLLSRQEWQLVVAVEVNLEGLATDIGTLEQALLDVCIPGRREQGREPIEAREHLARYLARRDLARPAHYRRHPEGALEVGILLVAKR